MDIRHFHIFFIFISVLCLVGFALWAFFGPSEALGTGATIGGGISGLLGVGLVFYGIYFAKKNLFGAQPSEGPQS